MAMFFASLGVRPDVMIAMHNPFFDLKFAVKLALAISGIAIGLHLSRPEASLRGWAWLLLIPAGLLAGGIAGSRVTTISMGKEKPIAMGSGEEAWAKNRRANFTITSK